jgi:hypothetical protein
MEQKMTTEDATELLKRWGDALDVNTNTKDFSEAIDTLLPAVRSERLSFDSDTEVFKLKLLAPLEFENSKKEILDIRELSLTEKECIQKYKSAEGVCMVEALYAKHAGMSLGEAGKIKGRDFSVITAVVTAFFS